MGEIVTFEGTEDISQLNPLQATLEIVRLKIHEERKKRRRAARDDAERAAADKWAEINEEIACVAYDVYKFDKEKDGDIKPSTKRFLESEIVRLKQRHADLVALRDLLDAEVVVIPAKPAE